MHRAVKYTLYILISAVSNIPQRITISRVEKHTLFFQILLFLTPFQCTRVYTSTVGKNDRLLVFLSEHHIHPILFLGKWPQNSGYQKGYWTLMHQEDDVVLIKFSRTGHLLPASKNNEKLGIKVGVNPSLKKEMWLLMHLITKKTCTKMYKSIHFWNQKNQMNPMVATDFGKIMQFFRNALVTMVTIKFFLDSITKIWFY